LQLKVKFCWFIVFNVRRGKHTQKKLRSSADPLSVVLAADVAALSMSLSIIKMTKQQISIHGCLFFISLRFLFTSFELQIIRKKHFTSLLLLLLLLLGCQLK